MAFRVALFAVTLVVTIGLIILLNVADATQWVALISLGLVAIVAGATLGYFGGRWPDHRALLHAGVDQMTKRKSSNR
jgi:membrane protein DedA with SNARE-associated domain